MQRKVYETTGRLSVCPSVRPIHRQQQRWPADLLLESLQAGNIDRQLPAPALHTSCRRRSTALSSKCGQCPVDSGGTRLNTDSLHYNSWRLGVVVSGVRRMNEVIARLAWLVLGWVTVFGRVYHLGM